MSDAGRSRACSTRGLGRMQALAALLLCLPLVSCKESPSVSSVRWEIERQAPDAEFEKEFHLRLGRIALAMVKPMAKWALDEDDVEGRTFLKGVKRVDIGTYRVVSLPDIEALRPSRELEERLSDRGWSSLVKVREEDELVLVFTREDPAGDIRGLFVMALESDEMVLVSLEGNFTKVIAEMVADDPGGFASMLGS
jgi:hypothetical protein